MGQTCATGAKPRLARRLPSSAWPVCSPPKRPTASSRGCEQHPIVGFGRCSARPQSVCSLGGLGGSSGADVYDLTTVRTSGFSDGDPEPSEAVDAGPGRVAPRCRRRRQNGWFSLVQPVLSGGMVFVGGRRQAVRASPQEPRSAPGLRQHGARGDVGAAGRGPGLAAAL